MKNKSYMQLQNDMLDAICSLPITKYEMKALFLILRTTKGCLAKKSANLIQKDFTAYGIPEPSVKKTLESLIRKGLINWSRGCGLFEICEKEIYLQPLNPRLNKILSKNIAKCDVKTYRNDKQKLYERISMNE